MSLSLSKPNLKPDLSERSEKSEISESFRAFDSQEILKQTLNALPHMILILNQNRELVFYNDKLLSFCGGDTESVLGKRPGEILNCIYAREEKTGCGTSRFCDKCGSLKSILAALNGTANNQDFHIRAFWEHTEKASDLRVYSEPIHFHSQRYVMFTLIDISGERRRESLERIFFHDILNQAAAGVFLSSQVQQDKKSVTAENLETLHTLFVQMLEELKEQRDLLSAEDKSLTIQENRFLVRPLLEKIIKTAAHTELAKNKHMILKMGCADKHLANDQVLLTRVATNLLKNALEASPKGSEIFVRFNQKAGQDVISVHNPGVIPESIQHQIFEKYFTTKQNGRGLGAYGAKFLTENYLNGKIWFESSSLTGTAFFIAFRSK